MKTLLLAACGLYLTLTASFPASAQATIPSPKSPSAASSGPTDAEIVHTLVTANAIDIDISKLAQVTSKNKEVISFAKKMEVDRSAATKQVLELIKKLRLIPQDNQQSRKMQAGAKETLAQLKGLKVSDFDKAYLAHEAGFQDAVAGILENNLIPSSKNEELKVLLKNSRPAYLSSAEQAKKLPSILKK